MRFASKAALAVGFTLASSLSAIAADLPRKAASLAPYNWTGLYAGVNAGYGWATSSGTTAKGAIGGVQAGYNWQNGNIVWGVETDIQATGQKASVTASSGGVTITETDKASWLGTTRLRAGFVADRWFFYGTGGVAYTRFTQDGVATGLITGAYSGSNAKVGWTLGTGVEAAIGTNWSWKLEYLYASFSGFTNTYALTGGTITNNYSRVNENIVRAGFNYSFR